MSFIGYLGQMIAEDSYFLQLGLHPSAPVSNDYSMLITLVLVICALAIGYILERFVHKRHR